MSDELFADYTEIIESIDGRVLVTRIDEPGITEIGHRLSSTCVVINEPNGEVAIFHDESQKKGDGWK